ncbi:MAG: class I SAM-dependent methyltransferase, partial [Sulfuricurvum sp.]
MYENKDQSYYFLSIRDDLIRLIPQSFRECNVLEIGCGNGATLNKLKQLGIAKTTTGVELFSSKDNHYSNIDHFFLENVENMLFPSYLHNSFDIIIVGDVIEHLVDPWSALQKITQL